jgi:ferritin
VLRGVPVVAEVEDGEIEFGETVDVFKVVVAEDEYLQVLGLVEELADFGCDDRDFQIFEG